jgi:hypothetical protein
MGQVKKISLCTVCILILLVTLDQVVGVISEKLYFGSKYGIFHRQVYCMNESQDSILILGSSRTAHHYVPKIIEDTLGISCTNAGSDGMCVYYNYAILASYINRGVTPRLVVCEVTHKDIEYIGSGDFTLDAALDRLAPHYGSTPEIDSLFMMKGIKEKIKLMSKTYRYNSKLVQLINCNFIPYPEEKGYVPIYGNVKVQDIEFTNKNYNPIYDPLKRKYIIKLIQLCKKNGINLVFTYSPYYGGGMVNSIKEIKGIAKGYDVPFWDYSTTPLFQKPELFMDESHMNDVGARMYSMIIAQALKSIISSSLKSNN